jgi:hypothetical protein
VLLAPVRLPELALKFAPVGGDAGGSGFKRGPGMAPPLVECPYFVTSVMPAASSASNRAVSAFWTAASPADTAA